jgi:hypothetical protein
MTKFGEERRRTRPQEQVDERREAPRVPRTTKTGRSPCLLGGGGEDSDEGLVLWLVDLERRLLGHQKQQQPPFRDHVDVVEDGVEGGNEDDSTKIRLSLWRVKTPLLSGWILKCSVWALFSLIVGYHLLLLIMFWSFAETGHGNSTRAPALFLSLFLNLVTILTLASTLWYEPITLALGLDDLRMRSPRDDATTPQSHCRKRTDQQQGEREDDAPSTTASVLSFLTELAIGSVGEGGGGRHHDATARWMGMGHLLAFGGSIAGGILVFVTSDSQPEKLNQPDIVASSDSLVDPVSSLLNLLMVVVYLLGDLACTTVLTLGSGHISLAHNLLAIQLEAMAKALHDETKGTTTDGLEVPHEQAPMLRDTQIELVRLTRGHCWEEDSSPTTQEESEETDYSENMEYGPSQPHGEIPHLRSSSQSSAPLSTLHFPLKITSRTLAGVYWEFQRRIDALTDRGLYLCLGVIVMTLTTESIVMVSQGFVEQRDYVSIWQEFAVMATFLGNSYSLWSLLYSLGRVLVKSRERLALEATKWALMKRFALTDASTSSARRSCRRDHAENNEASSEDTSNTGPHGTIVGNQLERSHQEQRHSLSNQSHHGQADVDVDEEAEVALASETAHMLGQFPIRFRVGVLELSEDVIKTVTLLLLGLAALFIGVSLPVL